MKEQKPTKVGFLPKLIFNVCVGDILFSTEVNLAMVNVLADFRRTNVVLVRQASCSGFF